MSNNDFELTPVLDMTGLCADTYNLKVEMYEIWTSGERFSQAEKKMTLDYVPQTLNSDL